MNRIKALLFIIFTTTLLAQLVTAQQAKPSPSPLLSAPTPTGGSVPTPIDTTNTPKPQGKIEIKGPGALYIFKTKTGLDLVLRNGMKSALVKSLPISSFKHILCVPPRYCFFEVSLSNGVTGIRYSDDIGTDDVSGLQFAGEVVEDKECPMCGVMMPFRSKIPMEKRTGNYTSDPAAYESLGKQMEDVAVRDAFAVAAKRIERIRRPPSSSRK